MRKLLLLVLFCAPMLGSIPPVNKEIINPAPKRFYINNLDIIEYHEGAFRVIFYMSENKGLHRDHDNNKDSDIKAVEKGRGCKNRPRHTAPIPRRPYNTPSRPALNGPGGRCEVKEKEVDQDGPQGLPETVRHNHYFDAPGANGAGG